MTVRSVYDSARLADGYAFCRPPVHERVIAIVAEHLGLARPVHRGLDIGCGAGRSTRALDSVASRTVGLDPALAMLEHRRQVAPDSSFVAATAEALPFLAGTFDLVTAAGSLNYVDLERCLADVERVLAPRGVLVIYDFSSGRRSPADARLATWYHAFEQRYPFPPGYDMDVQSLPYADARLRLTAYEEFDIILPMTQSEYLKYVTTETNVERAVRGGAVDREVRDWCLLGLTPIFGDGALPIAFTGYFACASRT
jgi:SAM-dependent methyltransferase